jgi:hypothetical protein
MSFMVSPFCTDWGRANTPYGASGILGSFAVAHNRVFADPALNLSESLRRHGHGLRRGLLHWPHVHSPHQYHRLQRPGSLALAHAARHVSTRLTLFPPLFE